MNARVFEYEMRGSPNNQWVPLSADRLAGFALEVCGGGWTVSQTRKAMVMQHRIQEGKVWKSRTGTQMQIRLKRGVA